MGRRCFIGVPVPRQIQDKLGDVRDTLTGIGVQKPVATHQFHITLAFLGDVRDSDVDRIQDHLDAVDMAAFNATVKSIGFFPERDYIRVIWAGVETRKDRLTTLASNVRDAVPNRYSDDKEFHPHITLSRVKSVTDSERRELQKKQRELDSLIGSFTIDRFVLYESTLTSSGPEYTEIGSYSLS